MRVTRRCRRQSSEGGGCDLGRYGVGRGARGLAEKERGLGSTWEERGKDGDGGIGTAV